MPLPLLTTTIGSFPKPKYTPIRDWFDISREKGGMNCAQTTRNYAADLSKNQEKTIKMGARALFAREPPFGLVLEDFWKFWSGFVKVLGGFGRI